MSGNSEEWCCIWFRLNYYGSSPSSKPFGAALGRFQVLLSGSWPSIAKNFCVFNLKLSSPENRGINYSFLDFLKDSCDSL
jgi:hypothetical protein